MSGEPRRGAKGHSTSLSLLEAEYRRLHEFKAFKSEVVDVEGTVRAVSPMLQSADGAKYTLAELFEPLPGADSDEGVVCYLIGINDVSKVMWTSLRHQVGKRMRFRGLKLAVLCMHSPLQRYGLRCVDNVEIEPASWRTSASKLSSKHTEIAKGFRLRGGTDSQQEKENASRKRSKVGDFLFRSGEGSRKRPRWESWDGRTIDYEGTVTASFPAARIHLLDADVPLFTAFCSGTTLKTGQVVRLRDVHPVYLRGQLRGLAMCSRSAIEDAALGPCGETKARMPLPRLPDHELLFRCPPDLCISRYLYQLDALQALHTAWGGLRSWDLQKLVRAIERACAGAAYDDSDCECGHFERNVYKEFLEHDTPGECQIVYANARHLHAKAPGDERRNSWDPDAALELQAAEAVLGKATEAVVPMCLALPSASEQAKQHSGQPPIWLLSFGSSSRTPRREATAQDTGRGPQSLPKGAQVPKDHVWLGEVLLLRGDGFAFPTWEATERFLENASWAEDVCGRDGSAPVQGYRLFFLLLRLASDRLEGGNAESKLLTVRQSMVHVDASAFLCPSGKMPHGVSPSPTGGFLPLSDASGQACGLYSVWGVIASVSTEEEGGMKAVASLTEFGSGHDGMKAKFFIEGPKWFDFSNGWTQRPSPEWLAPGYVVGFTNARLCKAQDKGGKRYWRVRKQAIHLLGYLDVAEQPQDTLFVGQGKLETHENLAEDPRETPIGMCGVRKKELLEDAKCRQATALWELVKPSASEQRESQDPGRIISRVRATIVKIKICKVWLACRRCGKRRDGAKAEPSRAGPSHESGRRETSLCRCKGTRDTAATRQKRFIKWEASAEIEDGTAKAVVYADGSSAIALATGVVPGDARMLVQPAAVRKGRHVSAAQREWKRKAHPSAGMQEGLSRDDIERVRLLHALEELIADVGEIEYRSVQRSKYLSIWPASDWGMWTSHVTEDAGKVRKAEAILAQLCNRDFAGQLYHLFLSPLQGEAHVAPYELRKNVQMDGHTFNSLMMPLRRFRAVEVSPARSARDNAYGILSEILAAGAIHATKH
mmetsp:Transcript_9989/g.37751  ORF Transcript_9989/g.37751 Transcript_9989/m.37751 type:complete len:1055 (-) Transcript_9989:46-3210(-)